MESKVNWWRCKYKVLGKRSILWFQLEDMLQLIGTPQCIEHVMFQLKDLPQGFKEYRVKCKLDSEHNPIRSH